MARITAVELGADTCTFARTSVRRGEVHLSAVEMLDPAAFPGIDAFTIAVRQARRQLRLPRRCRAVVWGLPDGATRKDAAVKPLLQPLTGAGFNVERVVSPCNALSALARLKTSRGEGSTCWVAINRAGVAIVVVRPGKQIYAHSFVWDSTVGAIGSQARLLQRYSLVAYLSPEVKRAMAEARKSGTPVGAVVTCGNLPDLRSLTMPLIEELDVEVETLDSLEGLVVKPEVAEKIRESAPAIRLACAGAIARGTRPWDPTKKISTLLAAGVYVRAAVLAAAVLGIGYLWYVRTRPAAPAPVAPARVSPPGRTQIAPSVVPPPAVSVAAKKPESNLPPLTPPPSVPQVEARGSTPGQPGRDSRPPVLAPRTPAPAAAKPLVAAAPPAVGAPAPAVSVPVKQPDSSPKKPDSNPPAKTVLPVAPPAKSAVVPSPAPAARVPAPQASLPARTPESTASTPRRPPLETPAPAGSAVPGARVQPLVTAPAPNLPKPSAPGSAATNATSRPVNAPPPAPKPNPAAVSVSPAAPKLGPPPLNSSARPADKPEAGARAPSSGRTGVPRGPMPALLTDPVPRVTAILVSRDRRFATVDGGHIIAIGDLLGRRTVIGMDERSVVFREPSGVQIRVGLGGRLLGVERAAR